MNAYRERMAEYNRAKKWDEAVLIVMVALASLLMFGLTFTALYMVFGLNGPLGALAIGGLIAVAVVEVHKRL